MAGQITDFTKSRLTQAFEAKAVVGSHLLEDLQPVIVVHDLERGAFPPFIPWSVSGFIPSAAATFSQLRIRPSLTPLEASFTIDRVSADGLAIIGIAQGPVAAFPTNPTNFNTVSHDTRGSTTGGANFLPAHITADGGDDALSYISASEIAFTPITSGSADIAVAMPCNGDKVNRLALIVQAVPLNTTLRFSVYGRIFPIGS